MVHREAGLKISEVMEEEARDRVIRISIKTFLTEVGLILEATIHHRSVEEAPEAMALVNSEVLATNLPHRIPRVSIMEVIVLLGELDQ